MNTFALHHCRHLATNGRNFLRIVAQIAIFTPFYRGQGVNHAVNREFAPGGRENIVVPGDIRQHVLQHFSEVAVVLFVAFRRPDMRGALGDVDDDIPVPASRLGGGGQQQRLFHAAQLLDGSHAVMHQHNRRGVRQDRGQVLHRV